MISDKEAKNILEQGEIEYYNNMALDCEKDFQKLESLASECLGAIVNNEIYIVNNKDIFEPNVIGKETSLDKFKDLINNIEKDEDLKNLKFKVSSQKYKCNKLNGFTVFYPQHKRADISSIGVEIITSLSEYISKVLYVGENKNNKIFYRGHGEWRYKLIPGIYREDNKEILKNESGYIKEIIASYPQYFKECKSALDFLSVLQHNGFPTRLLDFSENPLIALYMACDNDNDNHADTMRISVPKEYFKYYDSDTVSVLSNIALANEDFSTEKIRFRDYSEVGYESVKILNEDINIKKLVHLIRNEKPFFKPEIDPKHLENTIIFVKPKQDFDRISRQSGLFALFGINGRKDDVPKIEYMNPPCDITHYIIPGEFKKKILQELSRININEASVYCDMEHAAKYYIKKSKNREIEKFAEEKVYAKQKAIKEMFRK